MQVTPSLANGALALALLSLTSSAVAQDASRQPRSDRDHVASIEVQARLGGGAMWTTGDVSVPGVPVHHGNTGAGAGHLGASISARAFRTGLGATLAYSHVFTGFDDHYGTHAIDLRLSERFTFFRARRSNRPLELSILAELGSLVAFGGATDGCKSFIGSCEDHVDTSVSATVAGTVVAFGFLVQYDALLVGVEGDYRLVSAIEGPVSLEHDLLAMVRVGIVVDL